jgi:hypothetical protein
MKITVDPQIMLQLEACTAATRMEFSGFGFVEKRENDFFIYDFVLLAAGTESYTEVDAEDLLELIEREDAANMRVWIHRHPLGDGEPGLHNWSGRDNLTIETVPLGSIPEMVKWSLAMVRTPLGWAGRIDNHLTQKTVHLPVEPELKPTIQKVRSLVGQHYEKHREDRFTFISDHLDDYLSDLSADDLVIYDPYGIPWTQLALDDGLEHYLREVEPDE